MAGTYKTPGRERLLEFLRTHPDHPYTADELSVALAGKAAPTGKSSLYRHLSELCTDGVLRKDRDESRAAFVYRYIADRDCSHHFHLKCTICGRLFHLECTVSDQLLSHILSDHHFQVDSGRSILYGICEGCGGNAESPDSAEKI